MKKEEFINFIGPIIQKKAFALGYQFPSAIIAQACKETGFLTDTLGKKYNNFFGMKCGSSYKGKSVNLKTKEEYKPGTLTTIKDNFRAFDTVEQGVDGYFVFISSKRYANLKNAISAEDYCIKIKEDGWATSSTYSQSLINDYIRKYDLKRFDQKTSEKLEQKPAQTQTTEQVTYKVKKGDTLTKISKKFGVSIEEIAKKNNIKNINLIKVGQVLKIK